MSTYQIPGRETNWAKRQIRIMSTDVAKVYRGKLVGDSPELMPLDNSLFRDFEVAVGDFVQQTLHLDEDDDMKYSMSTPKRAWNCLLRVWQAGG
eukprot:scaffold264_cov317-Pinguiococcus_pyrenoidosus.AAC.1